MTAHVHNSLLCAAAVAGLALAAGCRQIAGLTGYDLSDGGGGTTAAGGGGGGGSGGGGGAGGGGGSTTSSGGGGTGGDGATGGQGGVGGAGGSSGCGDDVIDPGQLCFEQPVVQNADAGGHLIVADVNGDNTPDLVTLGVPPGPVLVFTALTPGVLTQTQTVGASDRSALAVGDINNDNAPDIITGSKIADNNNGSLGTHTNNGTGAFNNYIQFAGMVSPEFAAAGNLDGQPGDDVIFATNNAGMFRYLSNGTSLVAGTVLQFGTGTPYIELADLNKDNNLDIAQIVFFGVRIHNGNGSGGFSAPGAYDNTPTAARELTIGLLDGDTNLDLVITGNSAQGGNLQEVDVMLATAPGLFAAPEASPQPTLTASPQIADMDNDGNADVVFAGSTTSINILIGDGNGGFNGLQTLDATITVNRVVVADLNMDGSQDLIVADSNNAQLAVVLSDP